MSVKRIVDTSFWEDDKIMDEFTTNDKLFFLYLMTNPHTTQLGIYKINEKQMAFEIGFTTEDITNLIDKFENHYDIIKYSKNTKEVAIKNYLCYALLSGGKPVFDLLLKEAVAVKDKSLLEYIEQGAVKSDNKTVKDLFLYLNQTQNIIKSDCNHIISNQKSYHESYHESSKEVLMHNSDVLIHENDDTVTNRATNGTTNRVSNGERIIPVTRA